jgi:hypothetical protein
VKTGIEKGSSLRLLTPGEIRLAQEVFKDTITWHKVWIHHGSYLPFNLQNPHTAMTPDGEIYFKHWYRPDFSITDIPAQHIFMHEMVHVWQHQHGMNVRTRGLVSGFVNYHYRLDGRSLSRYRMEQQASIVADYFLLQTQGYRKWLDMHTPQAVKLDGDITEAVIRKQY